MTIRHALVVAVLAAPAGAAAQDTAPYPIDRIAAIVGEVAIPISRVEEQLLLMRRQQQIPDDSAALDQIRLQLLNRIIEDELVMQAADRDTAVSVTDEQIQQAVDERVRAAREGLSQEEYERQLRAVGLASPDEHRRFLTDQLRVEMTRQAFESYLRQTQVLQPIPPTENEMREFFEEARASGQLGQRPPTITFRQLVIRPQPDTSAVRAAYERADSALRRVRAGEDFATVATEMSEDPGSQPQGGLLPWFRRGEMAREFEDVAFRLRPGQTSPVFPTQFGFHVVRVDRTEAAEVLARHILAIPRVTEENQQVALALADSVLRHLRDGAPFDSLLRAHHDTDEESLVDRVARDNLPPAYAEALANAQPGDLMGPLALPAPTGEKYAIVVFEESLGEGEFTFDELRDRIRESLGERNGMQRYLDELRSATYVEIRMGADGDRVTASRRD